MSTLRDAIRPAVGLALALAALDLGVGSASAQLIGRRTVIVSPPVYAVPGQTVVTTGAPIGYSPTVYSSGVVPAGYTVTNYASGLVPTSYSPAIVGSAPVATTYTTTGVYTPTTVYASPTPVVERARFGPRRTVYRYYYPY